MNEREGGFGAYSMIFQCDNTIKLEMILMLQADTVSIWPCYGEQR